MSVQTSFPHTLYPHLVSQITVCVGKWKAASFVGSTSVTSKPWKAINLLSYTLLTPERHVHTHTHTKKLTRLHLNRRCLEKEIQRTMRLCYHYNTYSKKRSLFFSDVSSKDMWRNKGEIPISLCISRELIKAHRLVLIHSVIDSNFFFQTFTRSKNYVWLILEFSFL